MFGLVADDENESHPDRKERVLHTRVPAVLEQELKRLAKNLRVPVSNVVRAILEDAVEVMDAASARAEGELHGMAERLARTRSAVKERATVGPHDEPSGDEPGASSACPKSASALDGVLGFQTLTLAADAACSVCGARLARGSRAHRGVRDEPGPSVLLGPECNLLPDEEVGR